MLTEKSVNKSDNTSESKNYVHYPLKLYSHSSHSVALQELKSKTNLKILDVGCEQGAFALNIEKSNEITGIDFIPESEATKRNFNYYLQYNLNKGLPDALAGKKYDYILCLDILEHLLDYELFLNQLKSKLSDDGKIIISLPNVANIYVRLNLLIGRFPYSDRGILDKTHLHFFTLSTIKKLLSKYNFEILKVKVTPIPVIEVLPEILKNNLGKILNEILFLKSFIFKRLFGYQFVVICKNK